MNEKEQDLEGMSLEDILKEFSDIDETAIPEEEAADGDISDLEDLLSAVAEPEKPAAGVTDDTIVFEAPVSDEAPQDGQSEGSGDLSDTVRLDDISAAVAGEAPEEPLPEEPAAASVYQEPASESAHAGPIPFRPSSRLRELKRKLVAGPEKRYYELSELGVGKLQIAMLVCLLVLAVSAGAAMLFATGLVPENRMRLMVFSQVLVMLIGALMGSQQMIEGVSDLFRGRFTLNTLLAITFFACCADSVFCLMELRVPICAAFTLEVAMSLWATYHRRTTEMGMMDTMRKATRLGSVVTMENYDEGRTGFLRGEGCVEDFMDHYDEISGPEKTQNIYALVSLNISVIIAMFAAVLHGVSVGVQILTTTLLVAAPASFFVSLTRPMAVLERRLHGLGTVLCGWKGVKGLCTKGVYPLRDQDLFPSGAAKMNGVKFYGDRHPDETIAFAAALMRANGGTLAPIFEQLLTSRNGLRYEAYNLQYYGNGGIGGEICDEPVLMGTLDFLKEMGVEIPDGVMVKQAVYVSIDGELSGLFAINYSRMKFAANGLATLSGDRKLQPVVLAKDFMITRAFLKEKFGINPRRIRFPEHAEQMELSAKVPAANAPALALTTQEGLAPAAYAITGARALRTAYRLGLFIHMASGILGMLIMAALAFLGAVELLTPIHVLLYQLVWMVPGLLVTMWPRAI